MGTVKHLSRKEWPSALRAHYSQKELTLYVVDSGHVFTIGHEIYWSEGYRTTYLGYCFATDELKPLDLPLDRHPMHVSAKSLPTFVITEGYALVAFRQCGEFDMLEMYTTGQNIAGLLDTPPVELSLEEQLVLQITCSLKSSGRDNERRYCGLSLAAYNEALTSLQDKGLLAKNKAVTTAGKNRREGMPDLYRLRQMFQGQK